jgi:hypothetical protein
MPWLLAVVIIGSSFLIAKKLAAPHVPAASMPLDAALSVDQKLAIRTALAAETNPALLNDFSAQLLPDLPLASAALHQRSIELSTKG